MQAIQFNLSRTNSSDESKIVSPKPMKMGAFNRVNASIAQELFDNCDEPQQSHSVIIPSDLVSTVVKGTKSPSDCSIEDEIMSIRSEASGSSCRIPSRSSNPLASSLLDQYDY